jgi:hypothetical protein
MGSGKQVGSLEVWERLEFADGVGAGSYEEQWYRQSDVRDLSHWIFSHASGWVEGDGC